METFKSTEALLSWIIDFFAQKFGNSAILKGGMSLRLMHSPRYTNDVDYVFIPFDSKKDVKTLVEEALSLFCDQNSEFAQAVKQSGRTATECVESAVRGCGNSISDIELYRRAAAFYFEDATVHFSMTIDLGDGGFSNAPTESLADKPSGGLSLSLDDLLF